MKLNIKHISKLANLILTPDEEIEFDKQLNDVLVYIETLNKLDTSGISPTAQVTGLTNVTRKDEVGDCMIEQGEALSETNKKHNGMFVVDKLVETT